MATPPPIPPEREYPDYVASDRYQTDYQSTRSDSTKTEKE